VIQASKRIKNETLLSSGATSVSFASVQYILKNVENINQKKIVLFGTGKIGRNTCENLIKHTENKNITLINRTLDKAQKIAGKFNLIVKSYGELITEVQMADVLVVATGATNPTVDKDILALKKPLLILDLSIPKNVHDNVLNNPLVTVVHLDQLSQMTDETLEKRKKDIPKANEIIAEVKAEFMQWSKTRKFAPVIHALKERLNEINQAELKNHKKKIDNFNEEQAEIITNRLISRITSHFAHHLKSDKDSIDESIMMIEKVFQLETQELS
jgi:glutamyl-tRNA reductase